MEYTREIVLRPFFRSNLMTTCNSLRRGDCCLVVDTLNLVVMATIAKMVIFSSTRSVEILLNTLNTHLTPLTLFNFSIDPGLKIIFLYLTYVIYVAKTSSLYTVAVTSVTSIWIYAVRRNRRCRTICGNI